jgi:hypothetical protein
VPADVEQGLIREPLFNIAAVGDRFESKADQQAFLDLLSLTEREHARPTESVQRQMMKSWGWMGDDE